MNFTDEETKKLPKWAQSQVRVLILNLATKTKELDEIFGKVETNVSFGRCFNEKPLPQYSTITFKLSENRRDFIDCRITEGNELWVSGESQLIIKSQSSNVVKIALEKRQ